MTAALADFKVAAPEEHPRLAQALAMAATIHLGTNTAAEAEAKIVEGDLRAINGNTSAAGASWTEALELLTATPAADVGADHHLLAGKILRRLGREDDVEPYARILYDLGWRWPEWVTDPSISRNARGAGHGR